ncbi:hypothetical protein BLNAU_18987 [Blattamonas nauphoetae]|uniref:Uncharacterized protein n=1 Tax=Blattamonas nauphoetae TaxID=2049346 RepID=A0ABQ9X2T7_9EUKA|nr:hypothetical protein BLNAU_18987 [Blattamonas nauphoetae]
MGNQLFPKTSIFRSLISLVKVEYPFDKALQDRAVQFLKSLEPKRGDNDFAAKLVFHLVPSSDGSPSGFTESIITLLSSPHSTVVTATLSFLYFTLLKASRELRLLLVDSDLTTKLLATVQPLTLPMSENEAMLYFTRIIDGLASLGSSSSSFLNFSITTPVYEFNVREMILQKVVIPSSQFVTFLITNRRLSRMAPLHFCGLSSDAGNALIAGADEQILGLPPIVQKWFALLGSSFSTRLSLTVTSSTVLSPNNSLRP